MTLPLQLTDHLGAGALATCSNQPGCLPRPGSAGPPARVWRHRHQGGNHSSADAIARPVRQCPLHCWRGSTRTTSSPRPSPARASACSRAGSQPPGSPSQLAGARDHRLDRGWPGACEAAVSRAHLMPGQSESVSSSLASVDARHLHLLGQGLPFVILTSKPLRQPRKLAPDLIIRNLRKKMSKAVEASLSLVISLDDRPRRFLYVRASQHLFVRLGVVLPGLRDSRSMGFASTASMDHRCAG